MSRYPRNPSLPQVVNGRFPTRMRSIACVILLAVAHAGVEDIPPHILHQYSLAMVSAGDVDAVRQLADAGAFAVAFAAGGGSCALPR